MDYEAAKSVLLDRLTVAEGTLKEGDLKGLSHKRTLIAEFLAGGGLVLVGGTYKAEGVLAEGLEARRQAILARQEAERIEAERVQAEAACLAAEREAERKRIANAINRAFQAFREQRESIVTVSGLVKALGIRKSMLERGLAVLPIASCVDAKGWTWYDLHEAKAHREQLLSFSTVKTAFLATCLGVTPQTVRRRLQKLDILPWSQGGIHRSSLYLWGDVRVLFPEPIPELSVLEAEFEEKKQVAKEAKEAKEAKKRQALIEKQERDRQQLMAMFPSAARATWPQVILSVGATNSGKTHAAIEALAAAPSGVYLAPLRLLAWEIYERLNAQGVPCDLVTGDEVIRTPNARHQAATVEMFRPTEEQIIVLDEAQMAADPQRGGAWTRVLTHAQAKVLYLCCAPEALSLLQRFVSVLGYPPPTVQHHQRLCPLQLHDALFPIEKPTESCIYIVFSRIDALVLKSYFEEQKNIPTSVLYGALPPDVRRAQAERFLRGDTRICVATDALGMGMNLPARYIAFTTLHKFDGKQRRLLTPAEVQQIAGRAGRFGWHEFGAVGACSPDVQHDLQHLFSATVQKPTTLRITPTLQELEMLAGSLQDRLAYWAELRAIPSSFQSLLSPCDTRPLIELAAMIPLDMQRALGLERCLAFVQAPVNRETLSYWGQCVHSSLYHDEFPLPDEISLPKKSSEPSRELLALEQAVGEREIFLWLAHRPLFAHAVTSADIDEMIRQKRALSQRMDALLCRAKLQQKKICKSCGKALAPLSWRRFCDGCYGTPYDF